jgi:hypothetical protein
VPKAVSDISWGVEYIVDSTGKRVSFEIYRSEEKVSYSPDGGEMSVKI